MKLSREKEAIRVVSDQYGSPTSAADLAEAILRISDILQQHTALDWGTYHYCGRGIVSWHKFAQTIVDLCRHKGKVKTKRVDPIKTADYPTRVKRPPYSALDCGLINKRFGITPKPWQNSLAITVHELLLSSSGLKED
jgi:dTDP-4-dehydrorhamnose reductase